MCSQALILLDNDWAMVADDHGSQNTQKTWLPIMLRELLFGQEKAVLESGRELLISFAVTFVS